MILQAVTATLLLLQATSGSIIGTVLDGTTGQPIADARIELTKLPAPLIPTPTAPPTATPTAPVALGPAVRISPATSDSSGRFTFQGLAFGPYLLRVLKEGYAEDTTRVGTNNSSAQVILSETDASKSVSFRMIPGAAISGRVDGQDGRPVGSMEVGLFISRYDPDGRQTFQQVTFAFTDDRGEYRIFPVNPGQYYLSVGPPAHQVPGNRLITPITNEKNKYPRVFYPGTQDSGNASLIDVRPRGDLSGVNFRLSEQPTFRIRGRVVDSQSGKVPENASISVLTRESNINTNSGSASNIINPTDGTFELQHIAPGRYIIRAQASLVVRPVSVPAGAAPGTVASVQPTPLAGAAIATVEVTRQDVDGVVLSFSPPVTVNGKLQMQNGAPVPDGVRANFLLRVASPVPTSGAPGGTRWNADGSFALDGVTPGEYFVTVIPVRPGSTTLPYVREVRAGQVNLLDHSLVVDGPRTEEIVVTLGQNGGVISGTVNRSSVVATDRVVLVPSDRSLRALYKSTTITPTGSFTLPAVPPGTYKIFAFDGTDGAPFDPAFMSTIEGSGTTVSVGESANISVNVNVVRRP